MSPELPYLTEIEALYGLGKGGQWEVDGRLLTLTNLDKVLFPGLAGDPPVTKRELVAYFTQVSPLILPYLRDRAVNLNRFPNGVEQKGFWHKDLGDKVPAWLTRWRNPRAAPNESQNYLIADCTATLAWLGNLAAIELNPWTSSAVTPDEPSWALIDIDPGTQTSFAEIVLMANLYRAALETLALQAAPKVTGQRGIQIWVPIRPGYSFHDTRTWVEKLSRLVGQAVPDLVSWKWHKDTRGGLARLDYTQNAQNKTLVAPFSPRPRPGAPVSVPIPWEDLDDPDLTPDRWTIRTVLDRIDAVPDPLARLIGLHQDLPNL